MSCTVETLVVVEVATVVVCVTVPRVTRQEHADEVAAGELALRHGGADDAARLALAAEEGAQVEALTVVVVVPAMKVEVVVLRGSLVLMVLWLGYV